MIILAKNILFLIALGMLLTGGLFQTLARHHLSTAGLQQRGLVYWLGAFAGRSYFTERGWRYLNWSTVLVFGGLFVGLIWYLVVLYI